MDPLTSPPPPQHYCASDLRSFGDRFGIDYCFSGAAKTPAGAAVLRGNVVEQPLSSGLHLTHSCLEVLRPYETLSTRSTAFFLLVVLEGSVQLTIAGQRYLAQAGMALTTHLGAPSALQASHRHNQSLKTLTIALDTNPDSATPAPSWLAEGFPRHTEPAAQLWHLPSHLHHALQHWQNTQPLPPLQQRLLLEGLALQLLSHGMGHTATAKPPSLSPGERGRLEKIRQQLDDAPHLDYSVDSLAKEAAMSPSSFRSKFRLMFDAPVFDYLRERRLALARHYLLQGYSVQQAAHLSGYRHATNFATAFRKHYGTAPSNLS